MKNKSNFYTLFLIASLLLVSACSGRKNVFEVEKETLDPTVAVKRNSLVLPPNYKLTTPNVSQERSIAGSYDSLYTFLLDPSSVNLKRVHGNQNKTTSSKSLSGADKELLELVKANSEPINEDIKDIVNQDAYNQVRKSKSFIRKILLLSSDLEKSQSLDNKFEKYVNINKPKDEDSKKDN